MVRSMLKIIKTIQSNKVSLNALWLICGSCLHKLAAFVVGILTARYLGPANYGLINYAAAYTTFFFSLSTLGINSILVKCMIDEPEEEGTILGTTLLLQGMSSLCSIATIFLIVFIVDYGEAETVLVVCLCSLGLFFQSMDTLKYWFQAKLLSKYAAIATTAAYIISSIYKLTLLVLGKPVAWFAVATSVDYLCAAAILGIAYYREHGPRLRTSLTRARSLLRNSYHFILSGLMVSIYAVTDKLMLKQMLDESAVGYYGIALSVCNVWTFILSAIIDSLNPVIMENRRVDYVLYEKKNRQLYGLVFYISIFVSFIMAVVSEFGIRLIYGTAYLPAAAPLRIVTWYVAFSYLGVARNAWIVCEDKQRYLLPLYIGAAVTNIALNYLLIPPFGAEGAAVASLITQITTILVFPALIKELRPNVQLMTDAILFKNLR